MNVRLNKLVAALTLTAFCFNITGCASNKKAEPNPSISGYEIAKPLTDKNLIKTENLNEFKKLNDDKSVVLITLNEKDNIYKLQKNSKNYKSYDECVDAYRKDSDIIKSSKLFEDARLEVFKRSENKALIDDRFVLKTIKCTEKDYSYQILFESNKKETAKLFFSKFGKLATDSVVIVVGTVFIVLIFIPLLIISFGTHIYHAITR